MFAGTRIAVYDILEYLAAGMTPKEIVADFPELTEANVRAAVPFATERDREQGNAIGWLSRCHTTNWVLARG